MNIPLKCIFLISDIYSGSEFPLSYWTDERQAELRLVPILVGQASAQQGAQLVKVLEPYFRDPETYFIISSDFCHWQVTLHSDFNGTDGIGGQDSIVHLITPIHHLPQMPFLPLAHILSPQHLSLQRW
jgi:hypothetical protein